MTKSEILLQLQEVFRKEFDDEELILGFETTSADIEDWDSLAQLSLVHEIEAKYSVKFSLAEIQELKNVGEMVLLIEKHLL